MNHLTKLFLRIEYAFHMSDAYLAEQRGDMLFAADCKSRAWEVERKLIVLGIQ